MDQSINEENKEVHKGFKILKIPVMDERRSIVTLMSDNFLEAKQKNVLSSERFDWQTIF